jgi:ketosteroid isomerase-like protein
MFRSSAVMLLLLGVACAPPVLRAQEMSPAAPVASDSVRVAEVLLDFLRDFGDLDWERFRAHFDDEASAFHPLANAPSRDDGRAAFETTFRGFFDAARSAREGPPFLDLDPHDLRIQMLGEVAVATFHLWPDAPSIGRRTVVLRERDGHWRIVHLHASMSGG